jgi:hypothetical protein
MITADEGAQARSGDERQAGDVEVDVAVPAAAKPIQLALEVGRREHVQLADGAHGGAWRRGGDFEREPRVIDGRWPGRDLHGRDPLPRQRPAAVRSGDC